MNISSAVINVLPDNAEAVIQQIEEGNLCEFHLYENGNIIVTIEGANTGEEMAKMKQIEKIPFVIAARLIYAYSEEELDAERECLTHEGDLPAWLNDDRVKAEDIKYAGDLQEK